ncbi:Mor transcription activator domain protein, partial [Candidatus Magnetomorum sp. HK-1]
MDIQPDEITMEELQKINEDFFNIVDILGMEKVIILTKKFGGAQLYLPKIETITRAARDRRIYKDYMKGDKYIELSRKYSLSKVYIRHIISH